MDNKILNALTRLCSLSEHCRSDIFRKLEKYDVKDPQEIVDYLCQEGFIDEFRYARAFARDKSSLQGWGSAKIRITLLRKNIPSEVIEKALMEIDLSMAQEKLHNLLSTKWRLLANEKDSVKRQAKLFRFAMGRGYEYDEIKREYDIIRRN